MRSPYTTIYTLCCNLESSQHNEDVLCVVQAKLCQLSMVHPQLGICIYIYVSITNRTINLQNVAPQIEPGHDSPPLIYRERPSWDMHLLFFWLFIAIAVFGALTAHKRYARTQAAVSETDRYINMANKIIHLLHIVAFLMSIACLQ